MVDDFTPATPVKIGAGQLAADATDLLSSLDMGLDLLSTGPELLGHACEPFPDLMATTPTSPDQLGHSFCDTYTDLSSFLFGDTPSVAAMDKEQAVFATTAVDSTTVDLDSTLEASLEVVSQEVEVEMEGVVMEAAEPVVVMPSRKRKQQEVVSSIPTNTDHDDYILKDKRARLPSDSAVVPNSPTKIEKYVQRRQKNNVASKRSRETRKQKFTDMEDRANELEAHNQELSLKAEQLEKLAKKMKDILVQRLAKADAN